MQRNVLNVYTFDEDYRNESWDYKKAKRWHLLVRLLDGGNNLGFEGVGDTNYTVPVWDYSFRILKKEGELKLRLKSL